MRDLPLVAGQPREGLELPAALRCRGGRVAGCRACGEERPQEERVVI